MPRLFKKIWTPTTRAILFAVALVCVWLLLFGIEPALAQERAAFNRFAEASTLPTENIAVIIARVIRIAITLVGIIFVVMIIYAGFLYLLARGEVQPEEKAKKIFQQSIIGLIIIFSAYSIATFILNRLLGAAFNGASTAIADVYSEPLSGSLGAGIIDDHYPERDAKNIPRNTRIFVTFKEAIDPASIVKGYSSDEASGNNLNVESVIIYPTDKGIGSALAKDEVVVTYDDAFKTFVFDPVDYLGSSEEDTNYTVYLTTNIKKEDGSDAFSGTYSSGYSWTFEVSTDIDLTPPYVTSVVPAADALEPRNVTIEVNFSEAMDPVATTGSYIKDESNFTNIEVHNKDEEKVEGTFDISNAYRTISLTTIDACGEDPCGDTIYCLPTNQNIKTIIKAATINEDEIPQAQPVGVTFDGVVDAAGNSLDGNNDGKACGSDQNKIKECKDEDNDNDNYEWTFETNDDINDDVPYISSLDPSIGGDEISQSKDLEITFDQYLKSSTLNTSSVSFWPDPYYETWFAIRKQNNDDDERSTVLIEHPTLVSTDEGGWDYWPVLTQEIKSVYQICMYPAVGPGSNCSKENRDVDYPYCCNGIASKSACQTDQQSRETDPLPTGVDDYVLPDNTETEL